MYCHHRGKGGERGGERGGEGGGVEECGNACIAGSKMSGGDSVPGSKTLLGSLGHNMSGGACSPKKSGGSPKTAAPTTSGVTALEVCSELTFSISLQDASLQLLDIINLGLQRGLLQEARPSNFGSFVFKWSIKWLQPHACL